LPKEGEVELSVLAGKIFCQCPWICKAKANLRKPIIKVELTESKALSTPVKKRYDGQKYKVGLNH